MPILDTSSGLRILAKELFGRRLHGISARIYRFHRLVRPVGSSTEDSPVPEQCRIANGWKHKAILGPKVTPSVF